MIHQLKIWTNEISLTLQTQYALSLRGFRNIVKASKIFHYLNLECGIQGGLGVRGWKGEKETEYVDRLREREGVREVEEEGGRHH